MTTQLAKNTNSFRITGTNHTNNDSYLVIIFLKYTLVFLTLILTMQSADAQSEVSLKVIDSQSNPIYLAHVTVDKSVHLVTDQLGIVRIDNNKQTRNIEISYLGYEKIDTILDVSELQSYTIMLQDRSIDIGTITISATKGLFDKKDWGLKYIMPHELGFIAISRQDSEDYVYLFDDLGTVITHTVWDDNIRTIYKGLTPGRYHLLNDDYGYEIIATSDTILQIQKIDISIYENSIFHFRHISNLYSVVENWQHHNKKLVLEYVDHKTYDKTPLYSTFNPEQYAHARKVYGKIISLYYQYVGGDDESNINYGTMKDNIVAEGTWSGDLLDLIETNQMQQVYTEFTSMLDNKLDITTIKIDSILYVLDSDNLSLSSVVLSKTNAYMSDLIVKIPAGLSEVRIVPSDSKQKIYIESAENQYYELDISSRKWSQIEIESCDCHHPKNIFIKENTMYKLARKLKTDYNLHLFSLEIGRYDE